ncbi:hypothetical protein [Halomonas sp. M20]|uniref:hypothetical protein n=1 Tax=Halomonas sp. M20 TaxID=2763264 RepID=UPI001D09A69E|nr:hypothetical protein [Halomonas sp. M20]
MPIRLMTILAFTSIVTLSMAIEAQEISRAAPAGKHPYDIALEYCAERGGLAQYSERGETVRFSCSDELAAIITISS